MQSGVYGSDFWCSVPKTLCAVRAWAPFNEGGMREHSWREVRARWHRQPRSPLRNETEENVEDGIRRKGSKEPPLLAKNLNLGPMSKKHAPTVCTKLKHGTRFCMKRKLGLSHRLRCGAPSRQLQQNWCVPCTSSDSDPARSSQALADEDLQHTYCNTRAAI